MTSDIYLPTEPADKEREDVEQEAHVGGHDEEAFRYIVGYVQKKVHEKFPDLVIPEGEKCSSRWIETLSRGKLTIANQDLLEICRDLNEAFEAFHWESIDMDPNPIEKLQEQVLTEQEKNDVYSYVCNIFLTARFFNRIKHLNVKLRCNESAEKIRKAAQQVQHLY